MSFSTLFELITMIGQHTYMILILTAKETTNTKIENILTKSRMAEQNSVGEDVFCWNQNIFRQKGKQ